MADDDTTHPLGQMLARHAGRRERVLDEPVHRVQFDDGASGTFRLQLFTGDRLWPMAIATQVPATEGRALTIGAESYAGDVWRTYFPQLDEPPLWVQSMHFRGASRLAILTFTAGEDYALSDPEVYALSPHELRGLVGNDVDLERGEPPLPPPASPSPRVWFAVTPVVELPVSQPFRVNGCMPPRRDSRWRYAVARLLPAPTPSGCCWYHGGDWRAANAVALRLLATTPVTSTDHHAHTQQLGDAIAAEGISGWQRDAVYSLFDDPIILAHDEDDDRTWYVNGQHRGRAMRDAGVARTITLAEEPLAGMPPGNPRASSG